MFLPVRCSVVVHCYSLSPGYTRERTKEIHYSLRVQKLLVCVLACLAFSRSGYSLAGGVFPICWKGLTSLLGCSTDLLNSCVQGPRAKTPPTTVRRGVPGICTYPSLSQGEAPLINKGDQVETYPPQQDHHYPHTFIHKHPSTHYHSKVVARFSN